MTTAAITPPHRALPGMSAIGAKQTLAEGLFGGRAASDPKRTFAVAPKSQNLPCIWIANSALSTDVMSSPNYRKSPFDCRLSIFAGLKRLHRRL
jgi:hypothetical protein